MRNTVICAVALLFLTTTGAQVRVRLAPHSYARSGRLEVLFGGSWGTVCDDGFAHAAARVVCYMLGFGRMGKTIGNRYGAGIGTIWMDGVVCTGR